MDRPVKLSRALPLALLMAVVAFPVLAQQRWIPFQGRVVDGDGNAFTQATNVTFTIYAAATGGDPLNGWQETHPSVSIIAGQINVLLGSIQALDDPNGDGNPDDALSFSAPRYLGIRVGAGTNQELVPRHQLIPSFHARVADTTVAGGIDTEQLADEAVTADKLAPEALTAPGTIVAYGGTVAPPGWVMCDGAEYDATDPAYAGLFATIGTTFGGSGEMFKVPDLRGRFVRGVDNGAGVDPDAATRGGGDAVGSTQGFATIALAGQGSTATGGAHLHDLRLTRRGFQGGSGGGAGFFPARTFDGQCFGEFNDPCDNTQSAGAHSHNVTVTVVPSASALSTEIRPANIAVNYLCKL